MSNFAVLFDLDGTLSDTASYSWPAYNASLEKFSVQVNHNIIKRCNSLTFEATVDVFNEVFNLSIDASTFIHTVNSYEYELMQGLHPQKISRIKPREGSINLLRELAANEIFMALGTSSGKPRAHRILDLLGYFNLKTKNSSYFKVIRTKEAVTAHKPDPQVYLSLKPDSIPASSCIVIEDTPDGIMAAKRAGMKAVAILTEHHSRPDFAHVKPDLFIDSFHELSYDILESLIK